MHRFIVHVAFACAAGLAAPHTAAAQSDAQNAAREHFEKGAGLLEAGDCQAAIVELEKSLALVPNAGTHINLGVCHEELGNLVTARHHYREAERMAEAVGDTVIAEDAAKKARELEAGKLARLTIRALRADQAGYAVALDGERVAPDDLGKYIYVAPGERHITASADQCEPYEVTVQVGKSEEAVVELLALTCKSPQVTKNWRRPAGYAGVAAGAAALLGSVGMGAWAKSARDDAFDSNACDRDTLQCTVDGQASMDKAHRRALYANIMAGAGVVLIGTGVALWLTAPKERESREARALVPLVSPDRVGVTLSGRF